LPTNISGTYTVLACADDQLAVAESDETNNCTSSGPITVTGADLVIRSITVPATAISGSSITVSDTTANQATSSANASLTRFYLVNGSTRVATLGTRSIGVLPGGASSGPVATSVVLPTNTTGTFTVLACADDQLAVAESVETNNCLGSTAFTITK
jgi:subtilase family serine protease